MAREPSLWERAVRPFATNEAETGDGGWYPELEPGRYEAEPQAVLAAAEAAVEGRERWTVVDVDAGEGHLSFEVETATLGFVDDVTVEMRETDSGTRVDIESESRVGEGDFGQNARTIREFFERLERELSAR